MWAFKISHEFFEEYLREMQFIWHVLRSLSGIHEGLNMRAQVIESKFYEMFNRNFSLQNCQTACC